MLLYIEDFKHLRFYCKLDSISKCEVYEEKVKGTKPKKEIKLEMKDDDDEEDEEDALLLSLTSGKKEKFRYHVLIQSTTSLISVGGKGAIQ